MNNWLFSTDTDGSVAALRTSHPQVVLVFAPVQLANAGACRELSRDDVPERIVWIDDCEDMNTDQLVQECRFEYFAAEKFSGMATY